jgi:hypothetical protein
MFLNKRDSEISLTKSKIFFNEKLFEMNKKFLNFKFFSSESEEIEVTAKSLAKKNKIIIELDTVGQNWINENKCTFICFACAEGLYFNFFLL